MVILFFHLMALTAFCSSFSEKGERLYELAVIYENGNDSIKADKTKSVNLYRQSAEKGFAPAQNYLGFLYYSGTMLQQNVDSALYWIEKAAVNGDMKAASNLGYLLSVAPEIEHDYPKAFLWLQKATDAGVPASYNQLGDMYRLGLGCEADTAKAFELYDISVRKGIPESQERIIAMMGNEWKNLSPDSALNLAFNYYPAPAPAIGMELLENIANLKNARALALLGDAYSRGLGVAYNYSLSMKYFFESALRGYGPAQFIIAELLDFFPDTLNSIPPSSFEDIRITEDMHTSQFWYEKAAEVGITDADEAYKALFETQISK